MKKSKPSLAELQAAAVAHADKVLNTTPFLPSAIEDDAAVRILANIKAALITAWAVGYAEGTKR